MTTRPQSIIIRKRKREDELVSRESHSCLFRSQIDSREREPLENDANPDDYVITNFPPRSLGLPKDYVGIPTWIPENCPDPSFVKIAVNANGVKTQKLNIRSGAPPLRPNKLSWDMAFPVKNKIEKTIQEFQLSDQKEPRTREANKFFNDFKRFWTENPKHLLSEKHYYFWYDSRFDKRPPVLVGTSNGNEIKTSMKDLDTFFSLTLMQGPKSYLTASSDAESWKAEDIDKAFRKYRQQNCLGEWKFESDVNTITQWASVLIETFIGQHCIVADETTVIGLMAAAMQLLIFNFEYKLLADKWLKAPEADPTYGNRMPVMLDEKEIMEIQRVRKYISDTPKAYPGEGQLLPDEDAVPNANQSTTPTQKSMTWVQIKTNFEKASDSNRQNVDWFANQLSHRNCITGLKINRYNPGTFAQEKNDNQPITPLDNKLILKEDWKPLAEILICLFAFMRNNGSSTKIKTNPTDEDKFEDADGAVQGLPVDFDNYVAWLLIQVAKKTIKLARVSDDRDPIILLPHRLVVLLYQFVEKTGKNLVAGPSKVPKCRNA